MTSSPRGLINLRLFSSIFAAPFVSSLLLMPPCAMADPRSEPSVQSAGNLQSMILAPKLLEASGATVGVVTIDNNNIFDLENPKENNWLYRAANTAHATTKPGEIRHQLLFKTGDEFSYRALQESERILRGNRYLHEVAIVPVKFEDGIVDVDVRTFDTWSLIPKIDFSRKGGANNTAVGIKEVNLFGTGMQIELSLESNVDRDSKSVKFIDHHLGKSWYSLEAYFAENSDGHERSIDFRKPFYSLDTARAGGVYYLDNDKVEKIYDRGELFGEYRHRAKTYELHGGWSDGLSSGWTRRYTTGVGHDEHVFGEAEGTLVPASIVPEDRLFVFPFFGIELMQDKFETGENFDQIQRIEDRYLGTRLTARLGYAGTSLGSSRDAWLISAGAQTAFGDPALSTLFLSANLDTRLENTGLQNMTTRVGAKYYRRQSEKRLFYASLEATYGHALDIDKQLELGGDSGLRGYPHHFVNGDKRALLTLEQRIFTDWYPFRLFRVGGAVFFDAGRTWGPILSGSKNPGLLKDVGIGLRIGNSRSGKGNMIHVDLAFPLDGGDSIDQMQLVIETRQSF